MLRKRGSIKSSTGGSGKAERKGSSGKDESVESKGLSPERLAVSGGTVREGEDAVIEVLAAGRTKSCK